MKWFDEWREGRKQGEVTVTAGKSDTALSAMTRMALFTRLCLKYDVNIARSEGPRMVITGRNKNLQAFKTHFEELQELGLV